MHWNRLYAPEWVARDQAVKSGLAARGLSAHSYNAHLLNEPWTVRTRNDGFFKVFTPYWKAAAALPVAAPLPPPKSLASPTPAPASDNIADWRLGSEMGRGAPVVARYVRVGEKAAQHRLESFLEEGVRTYREKRDRPDLPATSGLSENLTYGEISPRQVWRAMAIAGEHGAAGASALLRELYWREFAWHLLWHAPRLGEGNWRADWDAFPWREDNPDAERWRRGLTGEPMVDAGMRELFVTGVMHNRVRMITASYLTKHLLTHWKVGLAWFAECLTDWDPASNALNWQWVAGSGPDAAPYFRIFNPETQAAKFDPEGRYRARFLDPASPETALFHSAAPRSWRLKSGQPAPDPIVSLQSGRARALDAYEAMRNNLRSV